MREEGILNKKRGEIFLASRYIQEAIIKEIVSKYSKDSKILEVSCGDGVILKRLKELGYSNLTGTLYGRDSDIFNYDEIDYEGIDIIKNVNLLEKLPFEDKSFDVVYNTELMEHIENHRHALYELSRIVKLNGTLIIETPNIMRLSSRLNFFLSGFHKPRNPIPGYNEAYENHLLLHMYPVYWPMMDYFLYQFGMIQQNIIWPKRWRIFSLLLYIFMLPLIVMNTLIFLYIKERRIDMQTKKRLFKSIISPAINIGSVLIVSYKRQENEITKC